MISIEIAITTASSISAIATVFIGLYACMNHRLANAIKAKDEQHQRQIKNLFQAIVISNLMSDTRIAGKNIEKFKELYKGETKIF